MTSIKELLELDSKQTIFGTDTQISTFGGWGSDNKAFIKASPDMAAKLREISKLLPEIKAIIEDIVDEDWPDSAMVELLEGIKKWQDE